MAEQIGTTRVYTEKAEATDAKKVECPACRVNVVPRGITTTAKIHQDQAGHCPNCGHVFGRNSLLVRKVRHITVSGAGNATTIAVDGGTLQMSAAILPDYADNQAVTWSVSDAAIATISASGLLTAVADGTVTVTATAADGSGVKGTLGITVSNQA